MAVKSMQVSVWTEVGTIEELFDLKFKFKIGDIVYFKQQCDALFGVQKPSPAVVIERLLQQCPGGFQQQYNVHPEGQKSTIAVEQELTADKPPARIMTDEEVAAYRAVTKESWMETSRRLDKEKHKADTEKTALTQLEKDTQAAIKRAKARPQFEDSPEG